MADETRELLNLTDAMRLDAERELHDLRTLLADLVDLTTWMSGSADFGSEGQARIGWLKLRPALDRAQAYLAEEAALQACA